MKSNTTSTQTDIHWKDVTSSMDIKKTVGGYTADGIPVYMEDRNKTNASWKLDRLSEVNIPKRELVEA